MQLRFHCLKCDMPMRISRWETLEGFHCPSCQTPLKSHVRPEDKAGEEIRHCILCGGEELFRQKLFNRNLGVGIVVAGILVSFFVSIPLIPLLVVAFIDLVLYLVLPFMVVCYRCDTEHRGFKIPKEMELYNHLKAAKAKSEPVYPGAEESH